MAFSRRLGVVGILGISWFVAIGCGDDDGKKSSPGDGGEAGEAPTGGKATSGGSANNAGKGGVAAAGKGGSGGSGGASTSAGTSGDAGAGQVAGAGGEETVGGATAAGAGGAAAGAGGEGGEVVQVPVAAQCATECEIDDDCIIVDSTTVLKCNANKRCVNPLEACEVRDDCTPYANDWFKPCATSAECDVDFEACVDWQGKGYCAVLDHDDCFPGVGTELSEHGGGDAIVSVCVAPGACLDHKCTLGCDHAFVGGCEGLQNGDTCDAETELCTCQTGDECTSQICGASHLCQQCATSEDCPGGSSGLDTCVSGKCGCSEASVCTDNTSGGTPLCE